MKQKIPTQIFRLSSWMCCIHGSRTLMQTNRGTISTLPQCSIQLQINSKIGWYALLCGYIAKPLVLCQHRHYQSKQSRKTGRRWAIRFIHKCWNIVYQHWTHRNNAFHETEAINTNSGAEQLGRAIEREHALGRTTLPTVYLPYFREPLLPLLNKSIRYKNPGS